MASVYVPAAGLPWLPRTRRQKPQFADADAAAPKFSVPLMTLALTTI